MSATTAPPVRDPMLGGLVGSALAIALGVTSAVSGEIMAIALLSLAALVVFVFAFTQKRRPRGRRSSTL